VNRLFFMAPPGLFLTPVDSHKEWSVFQGAAHTCTVSDIGNRRRAADEIPSRKVDAILAEKHQRLVVAHKFSDRTLAEAARHADDRLHEVLVDGVASQDLSGNYT